MYQKTALDNGLRLITSSMPHSQSVCIAIFVGTGSRHESDEQAGLSHFIEHLYFKGTERRATAKEISEAIEGVGGILGGGTDKELTVYSCKVARPHFALALDVLADMMRHSKLDPQEIERERHVIIEEINMSLDSPQHRVDMLLDELLWPGQALGRDIAGSKETVGATTRQMILDYLAHQYLPNNVVISVAGAVDHQEVITSLSQYFGDWAGGMVPRGPVTKHEQREPRLRVERRDTEQAHCALAVPGLSSLHPDRFTLGLLNIILGEGMSSRLFQQIRERLGLAYAIQSYVSHFLDTGSVAIYAGVDPKQVEIAVAAIVEVLNRLKEVIPDSELVKAKEFSKGRLMLRMEDSRSVAGWLGGQELLTGRILTVDDVVSIIEAITPDDLQRVARELLVGYKLNLAVVGPVDNEGRLEDLLRKL
ncbi:M16 family metallopeptidase [Chloroflexota bacterium]